MTVSEVITKHFMEFSGLVRNQDVVVENSRTSEDIFEDAIITTLKKFPGEVDEFEAFNYIRKTFLTEVIFSYKKKGRDILVYTDADLANISDREYS